MHGKHVKLLFLTVTIVLVLFTPIRVKANITTAESFNLDFSTGESFQVQIQNTPMLFIKFTVQSGTLTGTGSLNTTANSGTFKFSPSSSGTLAISYPSTVTLKIDGTPYSSPHSYTSGSTFTVTWSYNTYTLTITSIPIYVSFSINSSTQQTPYNETLIEGTYILQFPQTFTYKGNAYTFLCWNNDETDYNTTRTVSLTADTVLNVTYISGEFARISDAVFAYECGEFVREEYISSERLILFDSSKFKNYGTFPSTSLAPTQTVGKNGYGLYFDGQDYAVVADSDTMDSHILMTVAVWVKPHSFETSIQYIIRKASEYYLAVTSNRTAVFSVYDGSNWFSAESTTTLELDTWYFILGELTGSEVKLYIDNVLEDSESFTGNVNPTSNSVYIGYNFTGVIDELQGYHRLLDDTERNILKANQIPAPPNYIFTQLSDTSTDNIVMDFYDTESDGYESIYAANQEGQTFTVRTFWYNMYGIAIKGHRYGDSVGNINVSLWSVDASGKPDTLLTSVLADANTIGTSDDWYLIPLSSPYQLQVNVKYCVTLNYSAGGANNYLAWLRDASNPTYSDGQRVYSTNGGADWSTDGAMDFLFKIYGSITRCGFVDNHIETPWATDGENVTVDYYIMGFQQFHSLITIDQTGGVSSNAYFKWSYTLYHAGQAAVTYSIKIRYTNLNDKIVELTFQRYLPKTGSTTTYRTITVDLNGTGEYARAWKLAIDGCNYMDEKSFQIRIASDTQKQAVTDENTGEYWWEYFFDLVDEDGNPVNLRYFDPFVKVSVLVQSDTGITTMIKSHTHLGWFAILIIALITIGVAALTVYVMTGGSLAEIPIIGGALQAAADWITRLAQAIANFLAPIGNWIVNAFISAMGPVATALVNALNTLWNWIVSGMDALLSFTGNTHLFSDFISFMGTLATNIANAISYMATLITQAFSLITALWNSFARVLISFVGTFVNMWNTFSSLMQGGYGMMIDFYGMWAPVLDSILVLLAIGYVLWLIVLWEDKGLGAVIDHIRGVLDILGFIASIFLRVIQLLVNVVTAILEAIPF